MKLSFKKDINSILQEKLSTSLSDNQIYPNFCLKASTDLLEFINFRRNKDYQEILEHVSKDLGQDYLNYITGKSINILDNITEFKRNDEIGNPILYEYEKIGRISSTTLRYIKVIAELISLFKDLNNLNICEIGVGYGGQCRIINSISSPSDYTLVDIKPALMLSQRYLDNFILHSTIYYKTMNELKPQDYDLVISNYAFTELPRSIQEVYLRKIIMKSKRGYITYNEITPDYFNSFKKEEILQLIKGAHIIDEVPLTDEKNCIIVWGD